MLLRGNLLKFVWQPHRGGENPHTENLADAFRVSTLLQEPFSLTGRTGGKA